MSTQTETFEGIVVNERGFVHLPLARDIEVGGLTASEAEQRIERAYQPIDRIARIAVLVTDPAGHRATVVGAVTTPGRLQIHAGMRLADLIAAAGGPARDVNEGEVVEVADLDAARLVRANRALPVSIPLALEGNPHHNIRIEPGDHLYIPPGRGGRIAVLGKVGTPTVIPFRRGLRLTEVLAIAGGVTIDGDTGDIRVVRGPPGSPTVYTASLWDIKEGETHDVVLAAGDVVYVTEHWIASVGEVLNRLSPLLAAGTTIGVTTAVVGSQ